MKPFESFLAPQLAQYIAYRKCAGYETKNLRTILLYFDRHVKQKTNSPECMQPGFFLELRAHFSEEPSTANNLLSVVRSIQKRPADPGSENCFNRT